jgi:hypothetical protein
MPVIETIVTVVTISTAVVFLIMAVYQSTKQDQTAIPEQNEYWYDPINSYFSFSEVLTDMIDDLIIAQIKKISRKLVNEHQKSVPDCGTYPYSFKTSDNKLLRVTLLKTIKKTENNKKFYIYNARSTKQKNLDKFIEYLKNQIPEDKVEVVSIDTSDTTPKTIKLTKICGEPKDNQNKALDYILRHYNKENKFNTKIVISGTRGMGKSYVGRLLKKKLEKDNPELNVLLYDDFNPSSIGVNINLVALKHAKKDTPVIILINEIDRVFDLVMEEKEGFDPRLQHTRNRSEFHNMLDSIGDVPNVIAIYTTEMSDINEKEDYRSFVRKGRVDMFLKMSENDCTRVMN